MRTGGYFSRLQIAPQRDQQFARQRYDPNSTHPLAPGGKAAVEPLTERAVGLVAQPQSADFDQQRPHTPVPRFADPLFKGAVSTVVGHRGQPHQRRQFAPVVKRAPAE